MTGDLNTELPETSSRRSHRAIRILSFCKENGLNFDSTALLNIFKENNAENLPVAIISIAGPFRKGKSFLLNFFLKYLAAEDKTKWLPSGDKSTLKGFRWRGGAQRETTGIHVWSKVFRVKDSHGKEIALLLMDTQGTFDTKTRMQECTQVFALSMLISSFQIYNLSQVINECDLQHLGYFSEYGRQTSKGNKGIPFQKLMFLIRDWQNPYEYDFGQDGGNKYLEKELNYGENDNELITVRKHIRKSFESVECFLLPHPGKVVSQSEKYDGCVSSMDVDFVDHLRTFVELTLKQLTCKKVSGAKIMTEKLLTLLEDYVKLFTDGSMPEIKTLWRLQAEYCHKTAVKIAEMDYILTMREKYPPDTKEVVNNETLDGYHKEALKKALELYDKESKFGDNLLGEEYRLELEFKIHLLFEETKARNDAALREKQTNDAALYRKLVSDGKLKGTVGGAVIGVAGELALSVWLNTPILGPVTLVGMGVGFAIGRWVYPGVKMYLREKWSTGNTFPKIFFTWNERVDKKNKYLILNE